MNSHSKRLNARTPINHPLSAWLVAVLGIFSTVTTHAQETVMAVNGYTVSVFKERRSFDDLVSMRVVGNGVDARAAIHLNGVVTDITVSDTDGNDEPNIVITTEKTSLRSNAAREFEVNRDAKRIIMIR